MTLLQNKVHLVIHELPKQEVKTKETSEVGVPTPAHLGVTAKAEASGQFVHREATSHWGVGAGVVTTLAPPPVTGGTHSGSYSPIPFSKFETIESSQLFGYNYPVPQLISPNLMAPLRRSGLRRVKTSLIHIPSLLNIESN